MKNIIRIAAIILLVTWFVSVVVFAVGELLHLLFVAGLILLFISMRRSKRRKNALD